MNLSLSQPSLILNLLSTVMHGVASLSIIFALKKLLLMALCMLNFKLFVYPPLEFQFLIYFYLFSSYTPKDPSMNSETYHYKRGANQQFSQVSHVFDPSRYNDEELVYNVEKETIPIAIHCVVEEGIEGM